MTNQIETETTETNEHAKRAAYNRLVREARLLAIDLKEVRFKSDVSPLPDDRTLSFNRALAHFAFLKEEKAIVCEVNWTVTAKSKKKTIVKCLAAYRVYYDSFSEVSEEVARLYVENVAFASTYTYFRALYANLDWSAGLNSPPLPIVKFTPKV